jgi:hypothetical protein
MALLRDFPDDFLALCKATADGLGIPDPAFVEKDFWVVELLRSVVSRLELEPVNNTPCSASVMFKGLDADYDELAPVEVDVIAPVRTLAEKLALLHHAGELAFQGNPDPLQRAGRHFYDIHELLRSQDVLAALSTPGQMMDVLADDVDAKSAEYGWGHTPRPQRGYADGLVFDPSGPARHLAEEAYQLALNLVWGIRPTFDECLASIREAQGLL